MEAGKSEHEKPITEDQPSSNGAGYKDEARKMEEEVALLHAAFERGKRRRALAAESYGKGSVMELFRSHS